MNKYHGYGDDCAPMPTLGINAPTSERPFEAMGVAARVENLDDSLRHIRGLASDIEVILFGPEPQEDLKGSEIKELPSISTKLFEMKDTSNDIKYTLRRILERLQG